MKRTIVCFAVMASMLFGAPAIVSAGSRGGSGFDPSLLRIRLADRWGKLPSPLGISCTIDAIVRENRPVLYLTKIQHSNFGYAPKILVRCNGSGILCRVSIRQGRSKVGIGLSSGAANILEVGVRDCPILGKMEAFE